MTTHDDCCICLLPYEKNRGERKCDTCEAYTCYHCLYMIGKFSTDGRVEEKLFKFKGFCYRKKTVACYIIEYKCPCCRSSNKFNLRHSSKFLQEWLRSQHKTQHVFHNTDDIGPALTCEVVKPFSDLIYSVN